MCGLDQGGFARHSTFGLESRSLHEPLSLRVLWRYGAGVPLHAGDHPALPGQDLRAAAAPHRYHIEVPAVAYKESCAAGTTASARPKSVTACVTARAVQQSR